MNLHRRHLTQSQMAMVGAALLEPFEREAEEAQKATLPEKGQKGFQSNVVETLPPHKPIKATDKAGEAVGVSGRSIRDAKVIRDEGGNPGSGYFPIRGKTIFAGGKADS